MQSRPLYLANIIARWGAGIGERGVEQAQGDEDGGEDPKGLCRCHWEAREKKKSLAMIWGLVEVPGDRGWHWVLTAALV